MKLFLVISLLISSSAFAAPKANKLKTEHNFDDKVVNGKFQDPNGALVNVDDDKILNDLIGVRKNFKDRLKESAQRSL